MKRVLRAVAFVSVVPVLPGAVFAQGNEAREILTSAELVYPSSEIPGLFSAGTTSSRFAGEPEDRAWASDMEAQILLKIQQAREQGLIYRRADVECRSTMCAVLLVHAAPTQAVKDLTMFFRDSLGFTASNTSDKNLPLQRDGLTKFILGHSEIVLVRK